MADIKELLPEVQENVSLAEHTTFKIGNKAKYFFSAKTKEDIIKAIKAVQQCKLPFFVLAGGSNVLFSDNGFDGLIISIQNSKFKIQNSVIRAEAGVKLAEIVNTAAQDGLSGLEWAAGIPGSIGGAVRGNAGAFDASMADIVKEVEVLDINQNKEPFRVFSVKECQFGYRTSIFKKSKNLIILSVELRLQKGDKKKIEKQIQEYRNYRKEHHPLEFPSAGSVFKNLSLGDFRPEIFAKYPELNNFRGQKRVPVGFLIEKSGLTGKRIGDAQISEKHCNFIINLGKATAKDVLELIKLAKQEVKNNFGIELEEEIVYPQLT